MKTKIYDMAYSIDGDTADVEQDIGCGEVNAVYLHRTHIALLASEMGLLQGDADAWKRVATLERRLRVLRDRIESLDDMLWRTPVYPPGSEPTSDCVFSDATLVIAEEFCADLANTPKFGSVKADNTPEIGTIIEGKTPKSGTIAAAQGAEVLS